MWSSTFTLQFCTVLRLSCGLLAACGQEGPHDDSVGTGRDGSGGAAGNPGGSVAGTAMAGGSAAGTSSSGNAGMAGMNSGRVGARLAAPGVTTETGGSSVGGASLGGTTGTMSGGSGGLANGGVSNQQPTTVWNLTDYASYLGFMADTAIAKGATPIFVTPMGHRTFTGTNFNNTLLPYAQSMKGEASAKGLKGVDLNLRSGEYYEKVGNAFLTTNIFDGGTTHFIKAGAVEMATLIAGELKKQNGRLAPYMR